MTRVVDILPRAIRRPNQLPTLPSDDLVVSSRWKDLHEAGERVDERARQPVGEVLRHAVKDSFFAAVKSEEGERFESYAHSKEALFDYVEVP